jgi:tRNA modification GTPase
MNQTVAACVSPQGVGAIASVVVFGPDAWTIVRAQLSPVGTKPPPVTIDSSRIWIGPFGSPATIDEVVVTTELVTDQPWIEIHGHGGRYSVEAILEALANGGAATVDWRRIYEIAGRERAGSKVVQWLVQAPSRQTASILLDQYSGAFDKEMATIAQSLHDAPDEALHRVESLLRFAPLGRHLVEPWRVVIAGRPNVGKSSLLNALAGFPRSIVAAVPGTTRDLVAVSLVFGGWPVLVVDTAGIRDESSPLEAQGIALARSEIENADLCVWLVDASIPYDDTGLSLRSSRDLIVVNKIDLPAAWDTSRDTFIRLSAKTGEGVERLMAAIIHRLIPEVPPPGAAVPIGTEQIAQLERIRETALARIPETRRDSIKRRG